MRGHKIQTSLARARGLGSARSGATHWWAQRVTAIALIPLTLWFLASLAGLLQTDYGAFLNWIRSPLNTVLAITFVIVMFHHAALGLQTIVEDYVHNDAVRVAALAGLPIITLVLIVASLGAIIRTLA